VKKRGGGDPLHLAHGEGGSSPHSSKKGVILFQNHAVRDKKREGGKADEVIRKRDKGASVCGHRVRWHCGRSIEDGSHAEVRKGGRQARRSGGKEGGTLAVKQGRTRGPRLCRWGPYSLMNCDKERGS